MTPVVSSMVSSVDLLALFRQACASAEADADLRFLEGLSALSLAALLAANDGETALHVAARQGRAAALRFFAARQEIAPDTPDEDGVTPLHRAVMAGHAEAVRALLAAGACPATPVGATPSRAARRDRFHAGFNAFHLAAGAGLADILDILVAAGRGVSGLYVLAYDGHRRCLVDPLRLAVLSRTLDAVDVLLNAGVSPRRCANDNMTLLRFLCRRRPTPEIFEKLLAAGLDIHTDMSPSGESLLFAAAEGGWREGFTRLAALGVSPVRLNVSGNAPKELAIMRADPEGPRGPRRLLHAAVAGGDPEIVDMVIALIPAELNARTEAGWTPLHLAALLGRLPVVERLLAAGADPTITDRQGRAPESLAQSQRQSAVRARLLQVAATFNRKAAPPRPLRLEKRRRARPEPLLRYRFPSRFYQRRRRAQMLEENRRKRIQRQNKGKNR